MTGFDWAILASIAVHGAWRMALVLPLSLSVALVYKATRCESVRDIPRASLALWVTIVLGMYAVGIAVWLIFLVWLGR